MLNLDNIVSNKKENKDNNWPFRMLIIGPSGSGKTNTLLHLIKMIFTNRKKDRNGIHKDTNRRYNPDGFDRNANMKILMKCIILKVLL